MTDKPIATPLREDGPKIAAFLNGMDGGNRPTSQASVAGVHLDPALGLVPAVPGSLIQPSTEASLPAAHGDITDLEEQGDDIDMGPLNYPRKLHEAGEAAIQIVCNMCEAEAAGGNLRNIPEPILGWYVMTLAYQLCVLEACSADVSTRASHARQLIAARTAFEKYRGPYADGVREEVEETLTLRKHWECIRDDGTYGNALPAPVKL